MRSTWHVIQEEAPIHPSGQQVGFAEESALLVERQMEHKDHEMQNSKNNQGPLLLCQRSVHNFAT